MKKAWIAAVLGALLIGTLVGVVWARPNGSPQAAVTTRKVTLTGADFVSSVDDWDYWNYGDCVLCGSGPCEFVAPVAFPTLSAVTVERIRLHVNDWNDTASATATLYRGNPSQGPGVQWAAVSSPTGSSNGLHTYNSAAVNKVVWPSQRAYIRLSLPAGGAMGVYGVTVEYHVNS